MNDTPPRGERGSERGAYGFFSRKRGTQKWQQIRGLSNDGLCLVALPWICPTSGVLKIKRTASNGKDFCHAVDRRARTLRADPGRNKSYLISTLAPAASIFFLISSASALVTPSL